MSEQSIIQFLERVGFPIFVALWFLLRLEKRWDEVVKALSLMTKSYEQDLRDRERRDEFLDEQVTDVGRRKRLSTKGEP